MLKSPLRYPGGKGKLVGTILPLMGQHHTYVEACCGGAAVFWAKDRNASKTEVLNDVDGELVNFYHQLHLHGRRLAREVKAMPYSRDLFRRTRDGRPKGVFARAVRFWYVNRVSFGAMGRNFGVKVRGRTFVMPGKTLTNLDRIIERLRGVSFESLDVARLIKLYDRPDTLFYIDPPYWHITNLYRCDFNDNDHARLAESLREIEGTFLLSYNNCPEIRRMYKGCFTRRLDVRYSLRSDLPEYRQKTTEILISNRLMRKCKAK